MEQIYYSQCPVGYGLGTSGGLQVKRKSTGYPSSGDLRYLALRPCLPGTAMLAPPSLRYQRDGEAAEVAWLTPRASEYETEKGPWGRPGGYFAHGLRLEPEELAAISNWAAGLFDRPFWRRSDPEPTRGRPPEPLELGRIQLRCPPGFAEVAPLADRDDVIRLACLLAAVARAAAEGRTLFLIDRAGCLGDRFGLLTFAFPETMRPALTFSTYHDRPGELDGFRIQGTIAEARPDRVALAAQGVVADLIEGDIRPRCEPARWAVTLARWFVRHGAEDAAAWDAMNRRGREAGSSGDPAEVWSDARLDRLVGLRPVRRPSAGIPSGDGSAPSTPRDAPNFGSLPHQRSPVAPAGSLAAMRLGTLLERSGPGFLEGPLREAQGLAPELLRDAAWFGENVTERAWGLVPLLFRLSGRRRLRWDEFFDRLRALAYEARGGRIALRADWEQVVARVLREPTELDEVGEPTPEPRGGRPVSALSSVTPPHSPVQPGARGAPDDSARAKTACSVQPSPAADGPEETSALAVGIDLGTVYSVVAYIDRHGRPTTIVNSGGDLLTPSVVLFDGEEVIVGREALAAAALEPQKVAEWVKRDMGARSYRKLIGGEALRPEVVSSLILRKLKVDAERRLGPIRRAVITVPAYFDEPRRRATADAGRLAGLEVLDIINEPTAAALAYGHQIGRLDGRGRLGGERPLTVLVYDLGGGTFDVTILRIQGNEFRALATDGDVHLGGMDWDNVLVGIGAEQFRLAHREDPRENPLSLHDLFRSAEACKKALSERSKAIMCVNHLGLRHKVEVTRGQFEEATAGLLGRTRITTEAVVLQAGLCWSKIDVVLLVGGSTRMPMVGQMLREMSGKEPDQSVSADEAVAQGAALYADLLLSRAREGSAPGRFSIVNVNSHSLGMIAVDPSTGRRVNQVLIPKNTPLPHTATRRFKTLRPGQANVGIVVLEGESERPEACTQVGRCIIHGLPPDLRPGWPVEVSYTYGADGRLRVSGALVGHPASVTTDFVRDDSLSDEESSLWSECLADSPSP